MPKKFSKVNGKLVLENTRRTKPKEGDLDQSFDAFLEERYGSNPTPFDERETQSVSIDVDATSELEVLHDVISDEAVNALNDTIVEEEVPEEVEELTEETVYEQEEIVESTNPIMDRYVSAIQEHPSPEYVAEQDLQNSPASLADLQNVELSLRNIQTALTSMGGGGIGTQEVISLIGEYAPEVILDSAHLDYLASKLDSDFKFTDSDEVVAIIHYTVDSAYVQARADIEGTVDSAYVQQRVTIPDAILKSGADSDRTFAMNKGVFLQANNLSPQDALTLTYDGATALKIEKDGSLKINKTDFPDSDEVPNVGWVLKNSGDSAETIALIQEYRDSSWFTSELTKNDLGTLNDVDIPTPLQKDFLMWNGAQWVSHQQFADTGFHYKGDVDATAVNSAPANTSHGDMWTNNTVGIADSSWVGLGGSGVAVGDMLVYDSNHVPPEWDNFGHLGGGGGVSAIYEGFGIDVDNTTPANPVVSLDTVQTDDRYLQRTGGTLIGNVTVTNGNNLLFQNGAELRTNTWTSNGPNDMTVSRNGVERIKLTSSNTLISGQPIRYDGIDDTKITQDGHLITKSYASDNFITNKGGIITHTASSPDPNHAFRIIFSNTSVPSGASAVEVDLSKKETIGYRVEANPAAAGQFHTGVYAHQRSFPEVYANTGNKLIGFKYEAENGGLQNITIDAKFNTIHSLETKGTLLRSEVDGNERFKITHDGGITVLNPGGGAILNFDVTTEALTVEGDITSRGSLNAPSIATDNIVTDTITSNSSLTVNGNITTTGTITTTGNITANKVTSNSDIQVQNPNALKTNHIKSIGDSNIQIYRNDDVKMLWGTSRTQSHQPIEYQSSASSSIGADGRTRDLIDINYAETHIAGKTRVVNSLPSTLERGVLYFTSGNVLTVGV